MSKQPFLGFVAGFAACMALVLLVAATPASSPVEPTPALDVYYLSGSAA